MTTLHEKSSCCSGKIIGFGQRRRQCLVCKKTWRVWKRKRGRKRLRTSFKTILNYLDNQGGTFAYQASRRRLSSAAFRARVRQNLKKFIAKTPWPRIPAGPLLAVADALMQTSQDKQWTVCFILLRSVCGSQAIITPPFVRQGGETTCDLWQQAFDQLSEEVRRRIVALICDGARGLVAQAKRRGWILQRCHFHLRYRIANYLRTGPLARNRALGLQIKSLINTIMLDTQEEKAYQAVQALRRLLPSIQSKRLKQYLSGFTKYYRHYRSYLYHPELNLPITSNSAESLNSLVRDLQKRARGFWGIKSFTNWVIAICKHRKVITCNGRKYQPN